MNILTKETAIPVGLALVIGTSAISLGYTWGANETKIAALEEKINAISGLATQITEINTRLIRIEEKVSNAIPFKSSKNER